MKQKALEEQVKHLNQLKDEVETSSVVDAHTEIPDKPLDSLKLKVQDKITVY